MGIILLIISSLVTFYSFTSLPGHIAYDEILLARLALLLGKGPYTLFTSYADGHATPYFYLILCSFKLFGIHNWALRLPSALSGVIGSLLFYFIASLIFKKKKVGLFPVSFIISILFICLRWRLNFTRFSFEMPYLLMLELASIWFVLLFTECKKIRYLVLSGIFAGLAFHSYQPGRFFFIVPLTYILIQRYSIKQIFFYLFPFFLIVVPLVLYLVINPIQDGRVNQLSFIQNSKLTLVKKAEYISENSLKTTLMLFTKGDANGRHNFPYKSALNPFIAVPFIFGIVALLTSLKKNAGNVALIIAYSFVSIAPALLTLPSENPHMLRTYTLIPSIVLCIGYGLAVLNKIRFRTATSTIVLIILLVGCLYDLRTYFFFQSRVMRNSFEVVCPIEKVVYRNTKHIGDLPAECRISSNLF